MHKAKNLKIVFINMIEVLNEESIISLKEIYKYFSQTVEEND